MSTDATNHEPTDAELLRGWQQGDPKAGSLLYDRHAPALHRFFRSKVAGSHADIMQQTFLACLEAADRITTPSARAYLFGIARNLVGSHYRRVVESPFEVSVVGLDPSLSSVLHAKQAAQQLLGALRRIPLDDQIVIELHYWERLTTSELATALGRPQGTIKSHLMRARNRLKDALTEVSHDPALAESTIDGLANWAEEINARVDSE